MLAVARPIPAPKMNKLERAYWEGEVEPRKRTGEVVWAAFESVKFRLADNSYYTPDFVEVYATGEIVVTETKGYLREAARTRFKQAAEMYGWARWRMLGRKQGDWFTMYDY